MDEVGRSREDGGGQSDEGFCMWREEGRGRREERSRWREDEGAWRREEGIGMRAEVSSREEGGKR